MDDGPRLPEDALAMCRIAAAEGTRRIAATAHQNDHYPLVTPDRIRAATLALATALREAAVPLNVVPVAEVMAHPEMEAAFARGELLTVADRGAFMLVEMPHGLFVDLRAMIGRFRKAGVRVILAHPERSPELLHDAGLIEDFIKCGSIVQVNSHSITEPANREDERALRRWFQRGIVHVLGSDGHSATRRPPKIAAAYHKVVSWAGQAAADRIASTNGAAILQGLPLRIDPPQQARRRWFSGLWSSP